MDGGGGGFAWVTNMYVIFPPGIVVGEDRGEDRGAKLPVLPVPAAPLPLLFPPIL